MQFQDIKNGRFYLGDCLEVMKEIPDGVIDMILCDLPYGTTQNKWDSVIPFEPLWKQYWRVLKRNGAIVLTAQCPFDKILGASQIDYLKYEWLWQKSKATGHLNVKKQPMKEHENILVFYREQCIYNPQMVPGEKYTPNGGRSKRDNYGNFKAVRENDGSMRYPRSIQQFAAESGLHPTQKPVALFEYLIKTYTNEGDLVLDNCAGSGTTAIAAENTGRKWVCIEQSEEYATKAVERILNHEIPPQEKEKQPSEVKIDSNIPMPEGEEDGN